jgi:nucleoside-diphosphate-sugar epimerase
LASPFDCGKTNLISFFAPVRHAYLISFHQLFSMSEIQLRIPKGSLVLITGATGHIAAHTVKILLERGYRVRGTVRDVDAAQWMTQGVFEKFSDLGQLELCHVPDLAAEDAFADAIRGVSSIVHIAAQLNFDPDPKKIITPAINSLISFLEAANHETTVKSFVYTSSIAAAVNYEPGQSSAHVGRDSYNLETVAIAWADPPHPPNFGHLVYQASKVEAERALWSWVAKETPNFAVNVVSPSTVLGEALHKKHLLSPYPWIKNLYEGRDEVGQLYPAGKSNQTILYARGPLLGR